MKLNSLCVSASLREIIRMKETDSSHARCISNVAPEPEVDLAVAHGEWVEPEQAIRKMIVKHNGLPRERDLPLIPGEAQFLRGGGKGC